MRTRTTGRTSILRRMMVYLLLIVFTMLTLGLEFFLEVSDEGLKKELIGNFEGLSIGKMSEEEAFSPITHLRNKVLLLLVIQFLMTTVILVIFVKKINLPLKRMFEVSSRIAGGDLKEPIPVYTNDEIGMMGEFINDLISDFGEVVGLSKVISSSGLDSLEKVEHFIEEKKTYDAYEELEAIRGNLIQLEDMIKGFELYRVEPDGKWQT